MSDVDDPVATAYNAFYATWDRSPTLQRIWRTHVTGSDYPDAFRHISFVSLRELHAITTGLDLAPGELLADLGCGAGGPGCWVAHNSGARLAGRDQSAVAVARATERAAAVGLVDRSEFALGSFEQSAMASGSADGAMTVDALQYASDKALALAEFARVLRRGRHLAIIAFELDPVTAAIAWPDPVDDYRPLLDSAGFDTLRYEDIAGWKQTVRATYSAVIDARVALENELGLAAAGALHLEASLTLQIAPYCGHILAIARRR